jgi:hypothetical protein
MNALPRRATALLLLLAAALPASAESSSWFQEVPQIPKSSTGKGVKLMPGPKAASPAPPTLTPGTLSGAATLVEPSGEDAAYCLRSGPIPYCLKARGGGHEAQ